MKQKFTVLLLLVCIGVTAEAQLYRPFTMFRVIKTEKFDIIYPKESELSAYLLSAYADSIYEEISSVLGINVPGRIPVTFAPHTEMFNGYYSHVPNPHIVLYDTPMDLEWTTFEDNLKGLFIHELVHAITINTRNPFFRFLNTVFGAWASPALWNAPLFMIEGATISFESLGGFGRSNDPFVKQKLRQAIHENKFLSPFQASGVYDSPGQSGIWYDYGGLFSTWLQDQYGMEKYAGLWQAMGGIGRFSFNAYRSDFYSIFNRVYSSNFIDAWDSFRDSLALNNIEENPNEILPLRYSFFSEKRNTISAMAAGKNDVFILDRTEEKIRIYDTQTASVRTFNTNSMYSYNLDVSSCGTTILVSGYQVTGGMFRAVITEYFAESGRSTGRTIQGLYNAGYFRDGIIGLTSELHNNNIVYIDSGGNREILFRGNETLMFSGPQAVDKERITFIAARNGVRELLLYNYVTKELLRIENSTNSELYWNYMRGLSVSEGKLLFSHNSDDRMYKLAVLDLENMTAAFSDRDFSGGVSIPVSVNGNVYYRGNFFTGSGVLQFPESVSSISGTQINIEFTKPAAEDYGMAAAQETMFVQSIQNEIPAISSRPYISLLYMNPFRFWVPIPLVRIDNDLRLSLDGGGLFSVITDPTDRHMIFILAYADIAYKMANIDTFQWQTTAAGFPVTLQFSDFVDVSSGIIPYRETRIGLSASFSRTPGRWSYGFSLGGSYLRIAYDDYDSGRSAYQWEEKGSIFAYSAGFQVSNLMRRQHELFGTGLSFRSRGVNITNDFMLRAEARFQASAETRFPMKLVLYGAYDKSGMNLHGKSVIYGDPVFSDAASAEYSNISGLSLSWLTGAELSLGLFSFEIQRNLSHVYFNRFSSALSLRNILYDSNGYHNAHGIEIGSLHLAQSLVLKLGLTTSFIPLKMAPMSLEANIWGSWNFSNTITGKGSPWNIGFGVNLLL